MSSSCHCDGRSSCRSIAGSRLVGGRFSGRARLNGQPIIGVLLFFFAWSGLTNGLATEPLPRVVDGVPFELEPRAVFVGRNESKADRRRIVFVDLAIKNTSNRSARFDASDAVATLDGVTLPLITSLEVVRNARINYFERRYEVEHERDKDRYYWSVTNDLELASVVDGDGRSDAAQQLRESEAERQSADLRPPLAPVTAEIAAGETHRAFFVFHGFPETALGPELSLAWPGLSDAINLTAWSDERADVRVRRTGPRNCIGVVEVAGQVDRVGLHAINQALNQLGATQVRRAVIAFGRDLEVSETRIGQWLRLSLTSPSSAAVTYRDLMTLSGGFDPLILADPSNIANSRSMRFPAGAQSVIATSLDEAMVLAVDSVASRLERDDIVRELKASNNNGVKAAILKNAAFRLRQGDLPLVLSFVEADSIVLQKAAIEALAFFDDSDAVNRLVRELNSETIDVRRESVRGLLRSCAEDAKKSFDRLAEAVRGDAEGLQLLVDAPQEEWRPVFEHAVDSGDDELAKVGTIGILNLGGEAAIEMVRSGLLSESRDVRQFIANEITKQGRFEWLGPAVDVAKSELLAERVQSEMIDLISLARATETVPHLLDQMLDFSPGTAARAIRFVGEVATPEQEEAFAAIVPQLSSSLARIGLGVLFQRRSPHRFEIAEQLLNADEDGLPRSVIGELGKDGSLEAEAILIDRFLSSDDEKYWTQYSAQLTAIRSDRVYTAIAEILRSAPDKKKVLAANARNRMWQSSPGYRISAPPLDVDTADDFSDSEKEKLFQAAFEVDPHFTPALNHRGMLYLQWRDGGPRLADARACYEQALEATPTYAAARIGLGLCESSDGNLEAAERALEALPEWTRNQDHIDEYNIACIYGIMLKKAQANPELLPASNRNELIERWRANGMEQLNVAIQLGFRGERSIAHMQVDTDLDAFRGPEFDDLLRTAGNLDDGDGEGQLKP